MMPWLFIFLLFKISNRLFYLLFLFLMLKHKNVNAKKIPKEAIEHMKKNIDMDIVYSCLCSLCRSIGALPPEKRIIKNNAKSERTTTKICQLVAS